MAQHNDVWVDNHSCVTNLLDERHTVIEALPRRRAD